jgi:hypothetical protein
MITLYELLKVIDLDAELSVYDSEGYLLQEGIRGSTDWDKLLLKKPVGTVLPGIVTKIFLAVMF